MKHFALRYLLIFLLVCIATGLLWARFDFPLTGIDDSNIFFVYAENLARGHGFVYNVGGERVEGFSSLLWTLLSAAVFFLSSDPESILLFLNILMVSLAATVAVLYVQTVFVNANDNRYARWGWPLLFLILLLTSVNYLVWNTIALMENAVWSTLLLSGTIFVTGENISARRINMAFVPIVILLLLARPESFLWVGVFTAVLVARKAASGVRPVLVEMLPLFAAIVVTVAALTVFRLLYFGYPLPNTYYAKVSPSIFYNLYQGGIYFGKYFISNPVVSICIVATVLAGVHSILQFVEKRPLADGLLYLPILAGIGLAAPMLTGGDHFSSFRFYQSIYPVLLLCLLYFVRSVLPQYVQFNLPAATVRWPQRTFLASLGLLLLGSLVLYQARDWLPSREFSRMADEFEMAADGREEGRFVQEFFAALHQRPTVGVVRAGGFKYAYGGPVIDLMGLNNLSMAHNGGSRRGEKNHAAFEKTTFYELRPDILSAKIVSNRDWEYKAVELQESWDNTVSLKGLYDDAEFLALYSYARVYSMDPESDRALVGWFRQEFLNELEASGNFIVERYEYPNDPTQ